MTAPTDASRPAWCDLTRGAPEHCSCTGKTGCTFLGGRSRDGRWFLLAVLFVLALAAMDEAEARWCGLPVEPEQDCPTYDGDDWPYPSDLDVQYAERVGGYFAPYTGRVFDNAKQVDIEHIVARHEAAQSGACDWTRRERVRFARDPLEVTIAGPRVNRHEKSDRDPAEWMPPKAQVWYATRWIRIKQRYGLSIDLAERDALYRALDGRCP